MNYYQFLGIGLLGVCLAAGCAGKGERIDLNVQPDDVKACGRALLRHLTWAKHVREVEHTG